MPTHNTDCPSIARGYGAVLDIRHSPWNLRHLQRRPFRNPPTGPVFLRSVTRCIFLAIPINTGSWFTLIIISYFKTSLMNMADLCTNAVDTSLTHDGQMFWNCSLCLQGKNDAVFPANSVNIHWWYLYHHISRLSKLSVSPLWWPEYSYGVQPFLLASWITFLSFKSC